MKLSVRELTDNFYLKKPSEFPLCQTQVLLILSLNSLDLSYQVYFNAQENVLLVLVLSKLGFKQIFNMFLVYLFPWHE